MQLNIDRLQKLLEERIKKEIRKELNGLANGYTIKDIIKKWKGKATEKDIIRNYRLGIEHELEEHTDDEDTAQRIALDHLYEHPDYYDKVNEAEKLMISEASERKRSERPGLFDAIKNISKSGIGKNDHPEESTDEEIDAAEYERDSRNSNMLHKILTHEDAASLCKYVKLVLEEPVAEKLEKHNEGTETKVAYYIGKIEEDIIVKDKQIILKSGYYSIEKFVNTVPRIKPTVYTGSYETAEDCIEQLINILIDYENQSPNITVTLLGYELDDNDNQIYSE